MSIDALPPGLLLITAALVLAVLKGAARKVLVLAAPLAVLAVVWSQPEGALLHVSFIGHTLVPVKVDALGRLFATIFLLMAAGGGLFALNQDRPAEVPAAFVYAGGAVGVALAGDLISLFVFWEIMAIASTLVLWSRDDDASRAAASRYVQVHLLGGVVLLAGIAAHVNATGSVAFTAMKPDSFGTWAILIGFLINAGAPPFSAWLPDAYPTATYSGTVFLSAFTTKTAVYVLIRGFPGAEILIPVGLWMVFYGIVYALLENDMRRILAYSIINQVGFMVTGIGIGSEMALNGAAAHAFTHIIYKALLLMAAGSVLYRTGKTKCTDLGGLFQSMPLTTLCGIVGALAISSFPWTSGFVSKSMVSQAAADSHLAWVWFGLTAASAGVFLHAGIKFPWFVFFQKDSGLRPADPPWNMKLAMVIFAALCIGIGLFPGALYALLPHAVDYQPYTAAHVIEMLQLLGFSGLAFFVLLPLMKRTLTITLDTDWLYRRLGPDLVGAIGKAVVNADRALRGRVMTALARLLEGVKATHGRHGLFARDLSSGAMAWTTVAVLGLFLAAFYS
ncbi:Na(+)/H(+) antiporter subunit D [Magnetospirillum sp. 64-120]|uniref:Na(+)/H(+) antiporter subunit D n=1 Tax=Magnetospirillum sp. 64-120 TaxID=1895778 RepID=UPI00092BCF60|nr:Na(+)/H(+) antiporter subunit D [Magnetospirillum sp. 64-120]OJX75899.1 MAG: Na(+)/H(+) antiporter subunit D [Magnetospirillum sp. 64-120]